MKKILVSALLAGLAFGSGMGIFFGIRWGDFERGIVAGIASGIFFGLATAIFAYLGQLRKPAVQRQELPGEKVEYSDLANHFMGAESVGGWLFLTKDRLFFKSHSYNIQNHELSIPLRKIIDVKPVMTLWVVPNGLEVTLETQKIERFVVHQRSKWISAINKLRP